MQLRFRNCDLIFIFSLRVYEGVSDHLDRTRDILHYFLRVHMHIGGSERPRDR